MFVRNIHGWITHTPRLSFTHVLCYMVQGRKRFVCVHQIEYRPLYVCDMQCRCCELNA